jgi:hypothetical protein
VKNPLKIFVVSPMSGVPLSTNAISSIACNMSGMAWLTSLGTAGLIITAYGNREPARTRRKNLTQSRKGAKVKTEKMNSREKAQRAQKKKKKLTAEEKIS